MIVSVIGLGFVGLTLALVLADKGVSVYGVEINRDSYTKISSGKSTVNERGIDQFLKRNLGKNFKIFQKLNDMPNKPDIFVICVATPLNLGRPDLNHLRRATESVGKYMKGDELIIVRSTCPVGTTRNFVMPILETELKKRINQSEIKIVFSPERTAEGVALKELTELPQIIGGINEESTSQAMDLFRKLTPTVIQVSSPETAEMIKLVDNSFRDVIFAYANEISLLCENAGVDANECISKANIHYPRNNIPLPSPGVGGPCLSKDPYLLAGDKDIIKNLPKQQSLVITSRKLNEEIPKILVNKIKRQIPNNKDTKIFVMGYAFKGDPETNDVRDSPTLSLVEELVGEYKVYGHDPVVPKEVIENTKSMPVEIEEGFRNANCVIIMTNHKNYRNLDILSLLDKTSKPCIFVDCWRLYDKILFENNKDVTYTGLGIV